VFASSPSIYFAGAGGILARRFVVIAASIPLLIIALISGDYLHLLTLYPYYRHKIAESSERPVRFPWGDAAVMATDGMHLRILIHDESGTTRAAVGTEIHGPEGFWVSTDHLLWNFFLEEAYTR
jgi:hypothetical protein